jgi:hemolysin activation/secretion protein
MPSSRTSRRFAPAIGACAFVFASVLHPNSASGQAIDRPADERPELKPLEPPGGSERVPLELPQVPLPAPHAGPLASGLRVVVSEVRVTGSTVFTPDDFLPITQPFEGREISAADLQDLSDAITDVYTTAGYVTSGATIPDQDLKGGILKVEVVEAQLVDVVVEGNRWLFARYLKRRFLAGVPAPVRIQDVEEQLQLLLQEPDILRVAGKLEPGAATGENVLALTLEERSPFGVRGVVANDNPPGIGSVRGTLYAENRSALGFSDPLKTRFEFTEGLLAQEIRYAFPITAQETTLGARFRHTDSEVVQSPFDKANIKAETWTGGIRLRHPLVTTLSTRVALDLIAERRRSTTRLGGDRFSFVQGPDRGRADVTVLRLAVDGSWRSPNDVVAARSTVNLGVKVWGATSNSGNTPDGRFVSWLGQVQWAHKLPSWLLESETFIRADVQLADNALLSLEQIAVGGVRTVRGYQENLIVSDQAVILSGEVRIPIVRSRYGTLRLAPFFDWGHAWNKNRDGAGRNVSKTIRSAGLGLRYDWSERISAYAYWGEALVDVSKTGENIQEDGFHLGIQITAF